MFRISRFALAIALMVGVVFSGFANGGSDADAAGDSEALESITLMVDGTWLAADNGEHIPEQGYEALTGIDLIINHPPHNEYAERLDLAFATGEIPDVFVMNANMYIRYANAGALYDMTELYENSTMKGNMSSQDYADALRIDGRLYGIPHQRGNGTLTYVRGDWLDALGMDPPTNYDEFIEMLRAFKYQNPDGLAPEDVIPITGPGLANAEYPMDIYLREFYQDATPDYIQVNGQWVDGMLQPNMVGALTRLRDAYAEGLIDTEIITNKTSTCRNKFYSGIVGAFNYWAGYWNDRLQDNTIVNVPTVDVRGIPAIEESFYVERPPGILAMSASVENPQAIFDNFFEVVNDNGEGQMVFTFGVEGESYTVNDGVIEFMPTLLDPSKPYNKTFIDPSLVVTTFAPDFVKQPRVDPSHTMFRGYNVQYQLPSASEVFGELQPEINAIKMNIIAEIVFGELTVEEGLAKYEEEIADYNALVLPDMNQ